MSMSFIPESSEFVPETEEFLPIHPGDEGFNSSHIDSAINDSNILWTGLIFKHVQSLRHFKDSKSFCDHVLKTGELHIVSDHFQRHIVDYQAPLVGLGMHSSQSYGGLSSLGRTVELVNPRKDQESPLRVRTESFPRLNANNAKYRSVMDEFIKSM